MAALDRYQNAVVHALEADGWTITNNPLTLSVGERTLYVDVAAERLLAAEKGVQKIAIEIKTFGSPSPVTDLQEAIGKFGMYEDALQELEPERLLYLAVPEQAYATIFQEKLGQMALKNQRIRRLLVYAIDVEEIRQWIPKL